MSEFGSFVPEEAQSFQRSQPESKERWSGLYFHHSRHIDNIGDGIAKQHMLPDENCEVDFVKPYLWLSEQVGFDPLFMAVGDTLDDVWMTGYPAQWSNRTLVGERIPKGAFDNRVMFSYKNMPERGVFSDYMHWHLALNNVMNNCPVSDYEKRMIFHPSWNPTDWLRQARKEPHTVQLVVPQLDMRAADMVSVRNKQTKSILEKQGFTNVHVARIPLER